MRIIYFCAHYVHGHDFFNVKTIENLVGCGDVYVLEPPCYLPVRTEGVKYIEKGLETKVSRFPHLSLFFTTIRNYTKASKIAREISADAIVIGEYEIISIWLFRLFTKRKSYLIHHYNLDQVDRRKVYKIIFNIIKNGFFHIVLEEFIRDHVVEDLGVNKKLVFCWNHPGKPLFCSNTDSEKNTQKKYDCVGLSSSNDDRFINDICENEKKDHMISLNKLRVVLKSRSQSYEDHYLKVVKGYIKKNDYDAYVEGAKCSLVCYPDTYVYRVSAVIMESIWKRQLVIGTNVKLMNYYKSKYPDIFYICDANSFASVLSSIKDNHTDAINNQFDAFIEEHSDSYIQEQMKETFARK